MTRRLTKRHLWCKGTLGVLTLLLSTTSLGDPGGKSLRDCVARAKGVAAVSICEQNYQARLKSNIARLTAGISARLDARQRLVMEKSTAAWQEFLRRERAMLDLSLGRRGDGLGPQLKHGIVTRLYEQREQQLREHLHNLSIGATPETTSGTK